MPRITVLLVAAALVAPPAPAQHRVTTPRQALGFDVGADYHLATYTQLEAYWRTLARESPRMVLREIGKTAEGRPQLMAIITAPANHKRLARYEDIARRRSEEHTSELQSQSNIVCRLLLENKPLESPDKSGLLTRGLLTPYRSSESDESPSRR